MATERLGRAILELAADASGLLDGVNKIEGRLQGFEKTVGSIGKALAGAFTVGAVTAALKSYADFTGQLTDLKAKTDISAEGLQKLKYAAEQNGGTLEQVTGAITKMGMKLAGDDKSALGALQALGLEFDEVRAMRPEDAFTAIGDAIGKVEDPMARSKLAIDLFGKSGAELLPMMRGNLSETAEAAERLGIIMSEDAVAAGDEFGDTMDSLIMVGQSLIAQVLEPIIPVLTVVAGWLGENIPKAISATRSGFDWLIQKGLEVELFLRKMALGLVELGNKVPWLGEKLGASDANVQALKNSVQAGEDALQSFTYQTQNAGKATDKTARSVATMKLDYDAGEKSTKAATKAMEAAAKEHERFANSVKRLDTMEWWVPFQKGAKMIESDAGRLIELETRLISETGELQAAAEDWAFANGAVLAPSIKAISTAIETEAPGWTATFRSTFEGLPGVIMGAIQGGGSVLGAVGAHIGTSLMTKFQTTFGPSIEAALPFGIGKAVTALLPMLGSLFGPALEKIGGFFKSLFGGPNAEELAGRELVAKYEANIQSMLTESQKMEAGNESWKQTVVVVRDAYLALGKTEAEALAAVEALWKASKGGAGEVEKAMGPIQDALDEVKKRSEETGLSMEELRAAGVAASGEVTTGMADAEQSVRNIGQAGRDVAGELAGAIGSMRFNIPVSFDVAFPDFGDFDMPVVPMAEGGIGRVTRPTLFLAGEAGSEDFAFSGGGRRFGGGGGGDTAALERKFDDLTRTLTTVIPSMVESAARHGAQTAGRRL